MDMKHSVEEEEHSILQREEALRKPDCLLSILDTDLNDKQKKEEVLKNIRILEERINEKGANTTVQKYVSLLKLLKALEREESDLHFHHTAMGSKMKSRVVNLDERTDSSSLHNDSEKALHDSLEKLNSSKRELAVKLREILKLKRQLDDAPSPSELIQYERRFSELYARIQEKLRQTRKHYATYNALLEMKDLMLKETSLLNSISSQFQDAITSTAGRMKLIDSMEGIVKGTQQKLEKVHLGLEAEQKRCDSLKEKYAAAIAEQRYGYSLLKTFQEECARNEKLRGQTSVKSSNHHL